jgi:hypothetical protein
MAEAQRETATRAARPTPAAAMEVEAVEARVESNTTRLQHPVAAALPLCRCLQNLFEASHERGQAVRKGSFAIETRPPVLDDFLAAGGAA